MWEFFQVFEKDIIVYGIVIVFTIGLLIFTGCYFISLVNTIRFGIPQVGTFHERFILMEEKLVPYMHTGEKLLDLGSGTGRALRFFEKTFALKTTGYEVDPGNFVICWIMNKIRKSYSQVYLKSFYDFDLIHFQEYRYIYLYLFPEVLNKLEPELFARMREDGIIITNGFYFKNHKPFQVFQDKKGKDKIFLYSKTGEQTHLSK